MQDRKNTKGFSFIYRALDIMIIDISKNPQDLQLQLLEKGREEGMEKEKLATARRLLSMGLSDEQVSAVTELPLKEIQKMRD